MIFGTPLKATMRRSRFRGVLLAANSRFVSTPTPNERNTP